MTNTSNTSNQQNPTAVNFLDEELFYVTDDRNRLITKSREAVINFISHSAYREEIVIIRLDDGYIWELDDHTSKLIASGYIYYKDLYSLEKLISERTFPGSELFDLELVNRKRENIKEEWQNILGESRDGHTSKDRDNFFDYFGKKLYACAFGSKTDLRIGVQELVFLSEALCVKRNFPIFQNDICKVIGLINLVIETYDLSTKIESGTKKTSKKQLNTNYSTLKRELFKLPPVMECVS